MQNTISRGFIDQMAEKKLFEPSVDTSIDKLKLCETAGTNAIATQMSPKMNNTRSSIDNEGTRL